MIVGENGVVSKAQDSKRRTETFSAQEAVEMALGAMTAEFMGNVWPNDTGANIGDWATVGKFKEEVENNGYQVDVSGISNINNALLKDNNELNIYKEGSSANKSTFIISESSNGTSLEEKIATWTQTGTSVTNGTVNLIVGQAVTGYSVTVGSMTYGDTKWNVLGAKDGKLLITTNANVATQTLSGRSGYLNGISTLNTAVAGYINTTLAESIRTIDVDDINRVTKYNPATVNFDNEEIIIYNNEVTYYWQGTDKPYYYVNEDVKGNLEYSHNNFYYPDSSQSNGWASSAKLSSVTGLTDEERKITTLISNFYSYFPNTLTASNSETTNGISTDSLAYSLLFKDGNSYSSYWLGSQYMCCFKYFVDFGLRIVNEGSVSGWVLTRSIDTDYSPCYGVRPVVSLKDEVKVTSEGALSVD